MRKIITAEKAFTPHMRVDDIFEETIISLSANRARSGLTILGIVIGISSVIAMISIGQGAQNSIESSIEGLGSNLLTILPGIVQPGRGIVSAGRGSSETLKLEDLSVIRNIPGVSLISPELSRRFQVVADSGNNTNTTVTGATPEFIVVRNIELGEGNFISEDHDRSYARVAIIGSNAAKDLFPDESPLGRTVRVNKTTFKIIGLLKAKGGIGFSGPDDMILIPLSTMQKIVAGSDSFSTIAVSVENKDLMGDVQIEITDALTAKHRVDSPDFSIISQNDILGTLSSVITTFTIFLASIASISLLVGGIGIMNMMLTTVTERTREIGLRKAIGATEKDVTLQFLAEAVALTAIGGVFGILLGSGISYAVNFSGVIATSVSMFSVLLSFGVSAAIGIIFGYYPARRAARLNPIDALRYE